tara:strand:+ start:368 stop:1144 length:777 start_codon:yes stop_codon:yes gene_type:complete
MNFTAEQIQENWLVFNENIENYITNKNDRREKLLNFYKLYEERIILMPAAHKKEYHSAFPGGYVDHVNRVVKASLKLYDLWKEMGCDMSTFTKEELVFSAINHDIGKMGSKENEAYIPQTDQWRKDKLGEDYMFNKKLPYCSVPDRGLFLLQQHDISYSFNEMLAIQTHDGLYDQANDKYLKAYMPEQKPRTSLPYILHQADLMAARIEFEVEWLPKFSKNNLEEPKKSFRLKSKFNIKSKALNKVSSPGLKNMLDNL